VLHEVDSLLASMNKTPSEPDRFENELDNIIYYGVVNCQLMPANNKTGLSKVFFSEEHHNIRAMQHTVHKGKKIHGI